MLDNTRSNLTIVRYQYVVHTDLNNIVIRKFAMQRRLKQVLFKLRVLTSLKITVLVKLFIYIVHITKHVCTCPFTKHYYRRQALLS